MEGSQRRDVRNVTVVLGLRPFGTAILPQQVIGCGLRLMDLGFARLVCNRFVVLANGMITEDCSMIADIQWPCQA